MNKCDRSSTSIQLYLFPCAAQLNSGGPFAASYTPERRRRKSGFGSTPCFQLVLSIIALTGLAFTEIRTNNIFKIDDHISTYISAELFHVSFGNGNKNNK